MNLTREDKRFLKELCQQHGVLRIGVCPELTLVTLS